MSMDRANSGKRVAAQSANGIDLPGAYVATLVSESVAVESKFMESKPAEPAWVQPKLTVTEPKVTESKATESKFTESKPLESKTTELKPLEPKTAEPIANATSPKRKRLFAQPLPRPDPSKLPTRRTSNGPRTGSADTAISGVSPISTLSPKTQRSQLSPRPKHMSDKPGDLSSVSVSRLERSPSYIIPRFVTNLPSRLTALSLFHQHPSEPTLSDPYPIIYSPIIADVTKTSLDSPERSSNSSCYSDDSYLLEPIQKIEEDSFERLEHVTTRTVLRPVASSAFLGLFRFTFSKPSISNLRAGNVGFKTANFKPSNLFEEELDVRQEQWQREREGAGAVEVWVVEETETYQEESWRSLLQEVLYGQQPSIGTISVLGDYQGAVPRSEP